MLINVKKSCCLRIGPRNDALCANIVTSRGHALPWVEEIRYLGIFIMQSRNFKCSLDHAKRACYKSLNAIFGKLGRIASEEVVLELASKKCFPSLLYGLEACPLNKAEKNSLDFVATRFLMKLFKTGNINIVTECANYFNFLLPSTLLNKSTETFIYKYNNHIPAF